MTFDYATVAADALEALTEFGQAVTRRAYTEGAYTDGAVALTPADTTRVGVLLDFGAGQTLVRGTLIQAGDKRLLLDASAAITPTDHFIVGGVEYVSVSIGEINPAGTRVLYDLHLRS